MRWLPLGLLGLVLLGTPRPAHPADADCQGFPAHSLAQRECTYVQAAREHPVLSAELQSHRLGPPPTDLSNVSRLQCPDETAPEIRDLAGTAAGEVQGTYTNLGSKPVREVIVGFALFSARHELLDTIDAAVEPRIIPPGARGTFSTHVPRPAAGGWSCFRYEITGLVE